ncbi:MAG: PAS domain S-box protein [Thermoflexales bacterium]|nr:PAS domain S-box protein [Thermoflexales bacterium]
MVRVNKLSTLVVLSSSFVLLIAATSGLIGYMSLQNGRHSVEDLAGQLQVQILVNVEEKLGDYLAMPHRLNRLNADMIAQDPAMIQDLEGLHPLYIQQLEAFDSVATVAIGIEKQGNFAGAGRREEGFFSSSLMNRDEDNTYRVDLVDSQGNVIRLLTESPDYDARSRSWYQAAVQAGKAAWSPIYVWAGDSGIGITAVLPIYDNAGDLIAVQQSALSLDFIANFLQGLRIGKSGQVFLMEQDGMLVASSISEKVIRKGASAFERFKAPESADPFIRTASAHLISRFGDMNHLPDHDTSKIEIDGQRYFLSAAKLSDPHGLNWIVVTGLPESDVMERIDIGTRTTIALCIAASLAAMGLGTIIARGLASANRRLELEIAERERKEQALRESEERFRNMFERHDAIMLLVEPDTGQILDANRAAARFYGYSIAQLRAMAMEEINTLPPDQVAQERQRALREERNYFIFPYRLANGQMRTVEVHSSPIVVQGRTLLFSVTHDITERQRAEEALHQYADQLAAQNAELDTFAHTVAHDLKNPVGIIIGFATVLASDRFAMSHEEIADALRHILQTGKKLDRIIEELMLLAGVRKQEVALEALDMGCVVREAIERLHLLIQDQRAQITLLDEMAWPAALGYAPWVEEVWANYISNAIKYGGQPPQVEVGAMIQADGKARFWVRDNGPGLSAEAQMNLFTPFERLDQVRAKGHGLGLSIVRRIIEKLGGQVGVSSQPEAGSLFWFTLPMPNHEMPRKNL